MSIKEHLPQRLSPNNFTPPARTPWGGEWISHLKASLLRGPAVGKIGESWEVSIVPPFPSHCEDGTLLSTKIDHDRVSWLGSPKRAQTLLVKLLDAEDNLSIQVHPALDDPKLANTESGKPEAWWIAQAAPGAGIYLGFRDGVGRADVRRTLAAGEPLSALMNFELVEPGAFYVIPACTPHAIGAGVSLIEPQAVFPGRVGVTYRLWDWDRRYDSAGRVDPAGKARPLHLDRAMEVIDWSIQGATLVDRVRRPGGMTRRGGLDVTTFGDISFLSARVVTGTGTRQFTTENRFHALTCIGGFGRLLLDEVSVPFGAGESLAIPACVGSFTLSGTGLSLIIASPSAE